MKADLLIFDGRHLLWRTSDAFKTLSVEIGDEEIGIGGVYGFLLTAMRVHRRYGGQSVVAWEGHSNFRYKLFPQYKNKLGKEIDDDKKAMIEDMAEQERRLKAMLRAMGVRQYSGVGCEADDVIGRLATEVGALGRQVIIYTGDSDLRQLVRPNVKVVSPGRRGRDAVYGPEEVLEKHGVVPELIADQKALAGDTSDNIPGIPGIGPKTANILIDTYGGVEDVIEAAETIMDGGSKDQWPIPQRFVLPIVSHAESIRLYKKLTTIKTDCSMSLIEPKRSQVTLLDHIKGYKFLSLVSAMEFGSLLRMGDETK